MILNSISILNYKNIRQADLVLSPKVNCLIGWNGEGKTNVLDAIYYLSFCRSSSTPIDSQVITHDQDFFVIDGRYQDDRGDALNVYCGMKRGQRKHFKRDKKEYKRLTQHIGLIPLIFVSPRDTMLIEGGSEERRRLMDVVISQYSAQYVEALALYNKALQQRNAMLKMETEPDATLIGILEEEMARHGTLIFEARTKFIEELAPVFRGIYSEISESRESVALEYTSHAQRGSLLEIIQRDRFKDRAVGFSLHGTHKDDLVMLKDGYPIKKEGSQGQNKTFVIALKLAQFDFLRRTMSGTTPLLLLDDIFDKLDAHRVEQIVRIVSGNGYGQIFVTDTNRSHLDKILQSGGADYKLFTVANGEITDTEDVQAKG